MLGMKRGELRAARAMASAVARGGAVPGAGAGNPARATALAGPAI